MTNHINYQWRQGQISAAPHVTRKLTPTYQMKTVCSSRIIFVDESSDTLVEMDKNTTDVWQVTATLKSKLSSCLHSHAAQPETVNTDDHQKWCCVDVMDASELHLYASQLRTQAIIVRRLHRLAVVVQSTSHSSQFVVHSFQLSAHQASTIMSRNQVFHKRTHFSR